MAISQELDNAVRGSIHSAGGATELIDLLNAVQALSSTEAGYLDGVTAGTVSASKAVVVDANSAVNAMKITNFTSSKISITQTTVNAAGSAIGNAAALSYGMNVVGAADNSTGVILPVATANAVVEVLQTTNGKYLNVYPQVNSSIAGLGANTVFTTGTANTAAVGGTTENVYFRFVATNSTQWYVSK